MSCKFQGPAGGLDVDNRVATVFQMVSNYRPDAPGVFHQQYGLRSARINFFYLFRRLGFFGPFGHRQENFEC